MSAVMNSSSRTQAALAERTIVITGASSGFGKGVARRLAEQGSRSVNTPVMARAARYWRDWVSRSPDRANTPTSTT